MTDGGFVKPLGLVAHTAAGMQASRICMTDKPGPSDRHPTQSENRLRRKIAAVGCIKWLAQHRLSLAAGHQAPGAGGSRRRHFMRPEGAILRGRDFPSCRAADRRADDSADEMRAKPKLERSAHTTYRKGGSPCSARYFPLFFVAIRSIIAKIYVLCIADSDGTNTTPMRYS